MNVFHVGGRNRTNATVTQFGRAPFIRNCFIDGNSSSPPAGEHHALSMSGCHGGVVERNHIQNIEIGGPYQRSLNARETIVRNNTYRNVNSGPFWKPSNANTGIQKLLIENNLIELTKDPEALPLGILVYGDVGPRWHGQVIIRNNRFRYVDGENGSSDGRAIEASSAEAVIISDNLIETVPATGLAMEIVQCDSVTYFDNRNSAGELVLPDEDRYGEQLAGPAEEVFVAACFDK